MKYALLLGLLFVGCEGIGYDLDQTKLSRFGGDTGPRTDGGQDMPADGGDLPKDVGDTTDAGDAATADTDTDSGQDMGMVSKCELPKPIDPDRCNPTVVGECPGGGFCTLAVAAAPPPELLCVMRDLEGTGDVGTPCVRVSDCREGTTCVDWGLQDADPRGKGCARFCEIDTNQGCLAGEFCTQVTSQPPVDGIGYCAPTCDPYDAESCPAGQTCNVDFNYPAGTCEPHFRCVAVEDFLVEGDECGPGRAIASCSEDLVCYEVQTADFRCVAACQNDADCGGATCGAGLGPWQLRFCELP